MLFKIIKTFRIWSSEQFGDLTLCFEQAIHNLEQKHFRLILEIKQHRFFCEILKRCFLQFSSAIVKILIPSILGIVLKSPNFLTLKSFGDS